MSKNKMYFMINSDIQRIKAHEIKTPQKRQSSKIAASFVTPTTYELVEEAHTENRSEEKQIQTNETKNQEAIGQSQFLSK